MNILVACEESQRVCTAFREKGHNAFSCDILPCSGGHPEWHIQGDVLPLLNGHCSWRTRSGSYHILLHKWDMIIAFPPCTHLAISGARHFEKKRLDGRQRDAIEFFCQFLRADCERIAIENPVGIISGSYIHTHFPDIAEKYKLPIKPNQIIHPWMFGDDFKKSTCLWLKNIPELTPETTTEPDMEYFEWIDKKGMRKRQPMWYYKARSGDHGKNRSVTFPGIARAMAEQWG